MFEKLSPTIEQALQLANGYARDMGHDFLGTEHVVLGLLAQPTAPDVRMLHDSGMTLDAARQALCGRMPAGSSSVVGPLPQSPGLQAAMTAAIEAARGEHMRLVEVRHLIRAILLDANSEAAHLLRPVSDAEAAQAQSTPSSAAEVNAPQVKPRRRKQKPSVIPAKAAKSTRSRSTASSANQKRNAARKSRSAPSSSRKPAAAKRRSKPSKPASKTQRRRRP